MPKPKSAELAEKIISLEAQLLAARRAIPEAEQALAQAYADGDQGAIKSARAALVDSRDSVPAIVGALKKLDKLFHDCKLKEHTDAAEALSADTIRRYREIEKEIVKVSGPLLKSLADLFTRAELDEMVVNPILQRAWEILDAKSAQRYQTEIPLPPKPVPDRDADGELAGLEFQAAKARVPA